MEDTTAVVFDQDRASNTNAPVVDWRYVQAQLQAIPADFKSQKFNSLQRVIEILSSSNPQWSLEELQTELQKCEGMIDNVVDSYHLGFNRAIQNYSKILRLFNSSQSQVRALKSSLEEARERMGSLSRNLRTEWHTASALKESMQILTDVQAAVNDHASLLACIGKRDWEQAASLLLRLANRLSIEELQKLGALSQMREDLSNHRDVVVCQLITEIETSLFERSAEQQHSAPEGWTPPLPSSFQSDAYHLRAAQFPVPVNTAKATKQLPHHPRIAAILAATHESPQLAQLDQLSQRNQSIAEDEHGSAPTMQIGDMHVSRMLNALLQMDSLDSLRSHMLAGLVSKIRKVLEQSVENATAYITRPSRIQPSESAGSAPSCFVSRRTADSTHQYVLHTFSHVLSVMRNLGVLMDMMANSGEALIAARRQGGNGMALLNNMGQVPEVNLRGTGKGAPLTSPSKTKSTPESPPATIPDLAASVNAERDVIWLTVQQELLAFLSKVIRAPMVKEDVKQPQDMAMEQGAERSWLPHLLKVDLGFHSSSKHTSKLTFQFEAMDEELLNAHDSGSQMISRSHPRAVDDEDDYAQIVSTILQGGVASPFLTPALYTPTVCLSKELPMLLGLLPTSDTKLMRQRTLLPAFMDSIVADTLLPHVWTDARTQMSAMLSNKAAFTTRTLSKRHQSSRAVLQVAVSVEGLLEELSSWATAMPTYAEQLSGIVANVIARLLDHSDSLMAEMTSPAICSLVISSDVCKLISTEPCAAQIGDERFFMGAVGKAMQAHGEQQRWADVQAVGDYQRDALSHHLLTMRPIRNEDLLKAQGSNNATIKLAALSDALLHISEVVSTHGLQLASELDGGISVGRFANSKPSQVFLTTMLNKLATGALTQKEPVLPANLQHVVDRLQAQAGACLLALRLHLHLTVTFHIQTLVRSPQVINEDMLRDRDPSLAALIRALQRFVEDVKPQIPAQYMSYLTSDLTGLVCKLMVLLLPEVSGINYHGLDRYVRWLSVVKGSLSTTVASGTTSNVRSKLKHGHMSALIDAFDTASYFCGLLRGPVDNVLSAVQENFRGLDSREWRLLLEVDIHGRVVTQSQREAMEEILSTKGAPPPPAATPVTANRDPLQLPATPATPATPDPHTPAPKDSDKKESGSTSSFIGGSFMGGNFMAAAEGLVTPGSSAKQSMRNFARTLSTRARGFPSGE